MAVELFFERDDNGLKVGSFFSNVTCHFSNIGIVKSSINFIKDEKWSWLITEEEKNIIMSSSKKKHVLQQEKKVHKLAERKYHTNLWIANRRARAATVFSPPDRLLIGWKRLPGATQL